MERLTKAYSDGTHGASDSLPCGENSYDYKNLLIEKLGAYEDLEEQGRLVILPCNRGDKIYFIKSAFSMAHFPIEAKVTSICGIDCDSDVMYSSITEYNKIDRRFKSSDIGKTVFLTKSEAEAKLKELRGGENENIFSAGLIRAVEIIRECESDGNG